MSHACILPVGKSAATVKAKVKGQGVDLCLINGQGHYFWSTVNGVLAIFLQLILNCNLCTYTVLYKIYAALVEIVKIAAAIMFSVFIVSNIVSLAAIPIMHQEFIKLDAYKILDK